MSASFLSRFKNPPATEEIIIGSVISTDTKSGTCDDVNQKSATSINETTGVARIIAMGSASRLLKNGELPHSTPSAVPSKTEIKKEKKQRTTVAATCCQKTAVPHIAASAWKTSSGGGRMSGALITCAPTFHKQRMTTTDRQYDAVLLEVKAFIWKFSTY